MAAAAKDDVGAGSAPAAKKARVADPLLAVSPLDGRYKVRASASHGTMHSIWHTLTRWCCCANAPRVPCPPECVPRNRKSGLVVHCARIHTPPGLGAARVSLSICRAKRKSLPGSSVRWRTKNTAVCSRLSTSSSCPRRCRSSQTFHRYGGVKPITHIPSTACDFGFSLVSVVCLHQKECPQDLTQDPFHTCAFNSAFNSLQDRVEDLREVYRRFGLEEAASVKVGHKRPSCGGTEHRFYITLTRH